MTAVHYFGLKVRRESRKLFLTCEFSSKSSTFRAKGCRFSGALAAVHTDFRYCKAAKQYLGQAGLGLQEDKEQPWMLQPALLLSQNLNYPQAPQALCCSDLGELIRFGQLWLGRRGEWLVGLVEHPRLVAVWSRHSALPASPGTARIDRRSQPTATLHCLLLLPRPSVP